MHSCHVCSILHPDTPRVFVSSGAFKGYIHSLHGTPCILPCWIAFEEKLATPEFDATAFKLAVLTADGVKKELALQFNGEWSDWSHFARLQIKRLCKRVCRLVMFRQVELEREYTVCY